MASASSGVVDAGIAAAVPTRPVEAAWRSGRSAFEVREVLRLRLGGEGLRAISRREGMDRKRVRRYVEAAGELGRTGPVTTIS